MAKEKDKKKPEVKKPTTEKKRNAVCGKCQKPGHNARTCGK